MKLSQRAGYDAIEAIIRLDGQDAQQDALLALVPRLPRKLWPHTLRIAGLLLDLAGAVAVAEVIAQATPAIGPTVAFDLMLQAALLDDHALREALLDMLALAVPAKLLAKGRAWSAARRDDPPGDRSDTLPEANLEVILAAEVVKDDE